jgi:catechol 2,3-dioxygenase-like lactoylglutathione lyase family enzyme
MCGAVTARTAFVAMAASIAAPPRASMARPAREASWSADATIAVGEYTVANGARGSSIPWQATRMRVTDIDHVVIDCTDVEKEVAWWRDVIGVEPLRLEEWRRKEVPFVSVRINAKTIVDLLEAPRTGENVNHIALAVEDVDLEELAGSGLVDVVGGPAELFGARGTGFGLYIRDPEGNVVELRTY